MNTSIRELNAEGVSSLIEMAAAEGWNPGLDDAQVFRRVDPSGFLHLTLDGEFAAGISVIRYEADYSFLGLYICQPVHRGKGLSLALWQAGLERLQGTVTGLDGVVEQQANYQKSGFDFAYRNIRYQGSVELGNDSSAETDSSVRLATANDVDQIVALDTRVSGLMRHAYLAAWSAETPHRKTFVTRADSDITGMVTIRECLQGHKIGPLIANNSDMAEQLLLTAVRAMDAKLVTIDIPELNQRSLNLAGKYGLKAVFETARMYNGDEPTACLEEQYAVCSLELG